MMRRHELISDDYLAQQKVLHLLPQGYGGKGSRWSDAVVWLAQRFDCHSVLDYGCGEGSLRVAVNRKHPILAVREYDPAIEGKDQQPSFADLVVCTDVLEHVEPDKIGNVLRHIGALARKAILLVVALTPSNKLLPDGTNAHILIRPVAWWDAQVEQQGWQRCDAPDLPAKVTPEKYWVAVVQPC